MSEYIVPIGPQHPALKEPVHLKFSIEGEKIKGVDVRLGYVHRGIEKALESRDYLKNIYLIERICGICSYVHTTTYAQTVEALAGFEVPARANYIRTILLELERIHSHLLWLGVAAHEVGYDTLFMYAWKDRELVMDLLEKISGNRVNYSMNTLGGVRRDIPKHLAHEIKGGMAALNKRTLEYIGMLANDASVSARCKGVGVLAKKDAEKFCAVGPTARASGVDYDIRRDDPYAAYESLHFKVITDNRGDVYARVVVRLKELLESYSLVEQALNMPDGKIKETFPRKFEPNETVSHTEAPRGDLFYYAISNNTFYPERIKIRTPTYANFPALGPMLAGYTVAEIPIVVASIDPCISCTDRVTILDLNTHEERMVGKEELKCWK